MSTHACTKNESDDLESPSSYRRTAHEHRLTQWTHSRTGITVEVRVWERPVHMREPGADTSTEYELVVSDGDESVIVDKTTAADSRAAVAVPWMWEHNDGVVDLEAEELSQWEV